MATDRSVLSPGGCGEADGSTGTLYVGAGTGLTREEASLFRYVFLPQSVLFSDS